MKLTKSYLKSLIKQQLALKEGVISGDFSKSGKPAGEVKPSAVTSMAAFKKSKEPAMPEGTEWLGDASQLVSEIMDNIDTIAGADESLAERLWSLSEKLSPIFKSSKDTLGGHPQSPEDK